MPANPIDDKHTRKSYQWPADKLTAAEMHILHALRRKTGIPINHLVREGIRLLEEGLIKDSLVQKMCGVPARKEGADTDTEHEAESCTN